MTCPTLRPEYAEAGVKIAQRKRPHATDRGVDSGSEAAGGTTGRYVSPGASARYAFSGRDLVSDASIGPPSPAWAIVSPFVSAGPAMRAESTGTFGLEKMVFIERQRRAWAVLLARGVLGLIFFMAGFWKVFTMGPAAHAHKWFVDPYAQTFLPAWALWTAGVTIPFVELVGGLLMILGWRIREASYGLGAVLLVVTFGHLLAEPLYEFHTHVIPRLALLLFVLTAPPAWDRLSLDAVLARRATG